MLLVGRGWTPMLVTSPYSLSLLVGKANARFPRLEAFQWDFDANIRWKGRAVENWKIQTLRRWKSTLMLQQLLYWIFSGEWFQSTKSWSLELILITNAVYSPHRYKPPLWSTFGVGCDSTQNLLKKLAFWNIRHICTPWLADMHRNLVKHMQSWIIMGWFWYKSTYKCDCMIIIRVFVYTIISLPFD